MNDNDMTLGHERRSGRAAIESGVPRPATFDAACEPAVRAAIFADNWTNSDLRPATSVVWFLGAVVFLCSMLAVFWKRLHEFGREGWWCLVPIANIYWILKIMFVRGNAEPNAFGPPPNAGKLVILTT